MASYYLINRLNTQIIHCSSVLRHTKQISMSRKCLSLSLALVISEPTFTFKPWYNQMLSERRSSSGVETER